MIKTINVDEATWNEFGRCVWAKTSKDGKRKTIRAELEKLLKEYIVRNPVKA